jgi:capsular polysaccharide export protein
MASGKLPRGSQCFLFLQGPISPFFARLATALEARGHRALRVNLCLADRLQWLRPGAVNYRGSLAAWPDFIANLMAREAVTDLVLLGEQRPYHRAAILAARAANIRVTVTDYGYLRPDWITLEPDGMNALSRFPCTQAAIAELDATAPEPQLTPRYADSFPKQAAWEVTCNLLSSLLWMLYPGYQNHHIHHPIPNYLGTGWRLVTRSRHAAHAERCIEQLHASARPWWLFPMQMEVDYSIRAYSPLGDMRLALAVVIDSFARNAPAEGILVIKIHPLDPGLRNWADRVRRLATRAGVADRVVFLDGGALEDLLRGARGVVTVNSTVGLWALRAGVAAVTLGAAIYDVPGLTWQASLDTFWRQATPPDEQLLGQFIRALTNTIQIQGVFYREPGLSAAVQAAATWLQADRQAQLAARLAPAAVRGTAKAPGAGINPAARPNRPAIDSKLVSLAEGVGV